MKWVIIILLFVMGMVVMVHLLVIPLILTMPHDLTPPDKWIIP